MHHLRAGAEREWSEFPREAEGPGLRLRFQAEAQEVQSTLRLRQQDVKQTWKILLNGKELDRLRADENDMVIFVPIPAGKLKQGENALSIDAVGGTPDDIRVGEIAFDERPVNQVLSEASVEVSVLDATKAERPVPVPCRITVLNAQRALMTAGASSNDRLAVRPGVLYTRDGMARFGLPAGEYTIYAGRGFEYSIDSVRVVLRPGELLHKQLAIRREVPTPDFVSCDTHVHTLTYSGHGDATLEERVLTLAGEGVELPIATDHNRQIDYHGIAVKQRVRRYFTPVVGNEVTTAVGHFNIFPAPAGGPLPDHQLKDWPSIFDSIARQTGAKVSVLNHPRDRHSGFRPFGPERHDALSGENLDGWTLRANGVELVNSGAQQTDIMRTYNDWFGLLNRGIILTPVGASDSHDMSRYIVGQARTYIRSKDDDPGNIPVQEAVASFLAGRVAVSCGLLAEITVNDRYGPGDLVPAAEDIRVAVRVLGPGWVTAEQVELYANGQKVREARIKDGKRPGVKWQGEWKLPSFKQDVHLVAVATGPGVAELYWPIAKPYQPTSPDVRRKVIGSTGVVWIDGDGDRERTSAFEHARRLHRASGNDVFKLIKALADYDQAVAVQAASLLQAQGVSLQSPEVRTAATQAGTQVERGFQAFFESWRECQIARSQPR